MRFRHPRAINGDPPGVAVDVDGEVVTPDENGWYEADVSEPWLEQYASANGVSVSDLTDSGTCEEVKTDGEVCGRELPCAYHSED